jgi:hypothetical protein
MSDDFDREFHKFQAHLEIELRMMGKVVGQHEAAVARAVRKHREAIERARDEFDGKFAEREGFRPRRGRRRKPGPDSEAGSVPVKPNNPKGLSGGAAASIDAGD